MLKTSAAAAAICLIAAGAPAQTAPANTLRDMFAELNRCLAPVRLVAGTDVTIRFALNRRGGLIGKPRITHAHWVGDDADRAASARSIALAFDQCLPVAISDRLGGAIAGQLIAYRLRGVEEKKV